MTYIAPTPDDARCLVANERSDAASVITTIKRSNLLQKINACNTAFIFACRF